MNTYLNYIVEANLGLLLFLAFYKLLLHRETNFRLLRILLLIGILASLLFPLIHIQNNQGSSPLSISQVIPSYWLPEVVIGSGTTKEINTATFNFWKYTTLIYYTGLISGCLIIVFQLSQLFRIIFRSTTYRLRRLHIAESTENKPTFSFFHFIFIGQADQLSSTEKQQIIQHESVHARQLHSFDILLVNILKIFFWFNPFITTYKKIIIQLHEFEADARAVENSDVNKYCSLLARVALQSADFTLANHFNNSLTIKRIEMMRTLKAKIKQWKLVTVIMVVPLIFFFIACQDQVMDDVRTITESSVMVLDAPQEVQQKLDALKKANPEKKYLLIEPTGDGQLKLDKLNSQEGKIDPSWISSVHVLKDIQSGRDEPKRSFVIIEYNEQTSQLAEATKTGDVFTVVEEQPEFQGGFDEMLLFIQKNMRYPLEALEKKMGTVFVSFIVEKDGSISEVKTIRGVSKEVDAEAERVIKLFPKWIPGKQKGEAVRVRFVLPVKFKL
ncbi:MAG: M56 family metallopeptidase [Cyclobacteriaceae bacterium]